MPLTDAEAREHAARVEACLERLESVEDPARAIATEALQGLMALYGEALAWLTARVSVSPLLDDEVIAHVLLLHGLHPTGLDERVAGALAAARASLGAADVVLELVELGPAGARVRIRGGSGCGAMTIRQTVEGAIRRAAPDLERLDVELEAAPAIIPAASVRLRERATA
jgi:hypothetical protein